MPIEQKYFPLTNELGIKHGDFVMWRRKGEEAWKFGTVALIWLGIEETIEVDVAVGGDWVRRHVLYPALGDEVLVAR